MKPLKSLALSLGSSAALALTACSTEMPATTAGHIEPPPPPAPPAFEDQFAWSMAPGTNTLAGIIAFKPKVHEVWSCAGLTIGLTPETPYTDARMAALYGSTSAAEPIKEVKNRSAANAGRDYSRFVRSSVCDSSGRFAFRSLPDGAYFIIGIVQRVRPKSEGPDHNYVVIQKVYLSGGATTNVIAPASP